MLAGIINACLLSFKKIQIQIQNILVKNSVGADVKWGGLLPAIQIAVVEAGCILLIVRALRGCSTYPVYGSRCRDVHNCQLAVSLRSLSAYCPEV
jgi:hypothetical protein